MRKLCVILLATMWLGCSCDHDYGHVDVSIVTWEGEKIELSDVDIDIDDTPLWEEDVLIISSSKNEVSTESTVKKGSIKELHILFRRKITP